MWGNMTRRTGSFGRGLLGLAVVLLALSAGGAATAAASELELRTVSETDTTITFGWDTVSGADGFDFYRVGVRVSQTRDGSRTSVRFGKVAGCEEECYGVEGWQKNVLAAGASPKKRQCRDLKDNDGDGLVDYPADPGCASASDNDEFNAAPPPPPPVCSDGLDNDGDGKVDYPADPGCASTTDTDETDPVTPPPPTGALTCGSSLDAAYDAASPGAVIQLGTCAYSGKTITGSKAAPGVVFDLAGYDQGGINLRGATNVELRNGRGSANLGCQPGRIVLRNYSMQGIFWNGVCNVSWIGGELGPQSSDQINWIYSDGATSHDILLENLYVHDNRCVSSGCHYEAIRIDRGVDGIVIRNSVFRRNAIFHIFVTSLNGSNLSKNITIEGNCFDQPTGGSSNVALHDPIVTSVNPATLNIRVLNNFGETGSNFRGPFAVSSGNTFGPESTCNTWIPGKSTP